MTRPRFAAALLPIVLVLSCSVLLQAGAPSAPVPLISAVQLVPFLSGLSSPILLTNARDGSNRIFVVEQGGVIKVVQPGSTTPTVFLNITSKVLSGGEQGLLGLAFHPQYETNRRFFVNYTRQTDGATVVAEYHASVANPNVADTTETVLLTIAQPFTNHNGGMTEFGPDGYLYIGMGDGGGGNDTLRLAQNINELLGKILRIDINTPNGPVPYSSPPTNPFFGSIPGRDEIYAVGMRNPWRFSFDRGTGQLYVGDVGQGAREEVDIVTLGGNYGWRVFEGFLCTNLEPLCGMSGFTPPILDYAHTGGRCSITGGYVYRGPGGALPTGSYVYSDFCTREVFLLQGSVSSVLLTAISNLSSFGEDEAGEIYAVALAGTIWRIAATGPTCTFSLSPSSQPFPVSGGTGSVAVTGQLSCTWTSTSNVPWLTITSGVGSGSGTATYSVAANPGSAPRSGTMTIAGQTFTVNQAGTPCSFSISPTSNSFGVSGGSGTVNVTATSTCGWTATTLAPWITITSGATGMGNGMVAYSVAANTERTNRSAVITIAGLNFGISQLAAPTSCVSSINPTSSSFGAGGGTAAVNITAPSGCTWTTVSNDSWITITSGANGTGTSNAKYSVAANSGSSPRTGSISIGNRTLTVSQDASVSVCSLSLGATSQSFAAAGGTGGVSITAPPGCSWTAVRNDPWITITAGAAGTGSGMVSYAVAANSAATSRTGTMTIAGQTFTVLQSGTGSTTCSFLISPTGQSFASGGGGGSVNVTALAGCAWMAVSNSAFITITAGSSGTGNGTVNYAVAANGGAGPRTGTMTIAGQTFTVNQAGACAFSIDPVNRLIGIAGGTASVNVTAPTGCSWTAVSNVGWITISSGASGAGNGTVVYSVAPRPPGAGRTGTVTVAGMTHTVKQ